MADKQPGRLFTVDVKLHRRLKILAAKEGKTLRELTDKAIEAWLDAEEKHET